MKNSSIFEQLAVQKQQFTGEKKSEGQQSGEKVNKISCNLDNKVDNRHSYNQQNNSSGDSLLSIFSLGDGNNYNATSAKELQAQKRKRKKKKGIRR